MIKEAKIWVKHLTTHQCKIIRNILFGMTGARSVMGRGGLGATCAYVIEDGDLYDYMDIDETDYDWLPGKELNETYLLQMQPGDLIDEGRLFKQAGGAFYSTGAWGTVPAACSHVFIPIQGLSRILGYDCKFCGKKKEDC